MTEDVENQPDAPPGPPRASVRDHLANERTMLAWVRTSITLIGLGFLIGRLETEARGGWGLLLAATLVLAGTTSAIAGMLHFARVERDIDSGGYRPSIRALSMLTAAVVTVGLLLLAYLALSGSAER